MRDKQWDKKAETELPATRVCLDRQSALWAQFVRPTVIQSVRLSVPPLG